LYAHTFSLFFFLSFCRIAQAISETRQAICDTGCICTPG
jgi:hypothetical protein